MWVRLTIVLVYLCITLVIGWIFRKKASSGRTEFFLAGRNVTGVLLFFTMAATNFSAFTIFGLSGAGYRIGYAFYPIMGFGTGFMALSFYFIGRKILVLSRERNYVTPSDFIHDRYRSPVLKWIFSVIMIVFTLPYIAIQAIASGKSLESLVGVPYLAGALLVTVFIVVYVSLGGMRSIVWTDSIQGLMMIVFTLAAFILIARKNGGFVPLHERVYGEFPQLFSRPGLDASMAMGVWVGYMVLWFFADPMFPQLFQRFMAAKNEKALNTTIILYPLITTFLFFLTVSIGVMGRGIIPGLPAAESDTIFPLLLNSAAGVVLSTVLLTGSIAALMSTMDSQLLTLTSIITLDFRRIKKREILKEKLIIVLLGAVGFLIAIKPPQTILDFISRTTFNGVSVLAPMVIGGLYWRRANRYGAVASLVVGEAAVLAFYFKLVNVPGLHPVIPILAVTTLVFVVVSLLTRSEDENLDIVFPRRAAGPAGASAAGAPAADTSTADASAAGTAPAAAQPEEAPGPTKSKPRGLLWGILFSAFFILGNDFWAWGKTPRFLAGLPLWVWYYILLGVLLSAAYKVFLSSREDGAA